MSDKQTTDRRSFLKWIGFGTAGTVVAASSAQAETVEQTNLDGSARYSETEHVKKFYDLARF